ncbi:MAG: serine/threonine-protein kinase [Nannocystaceae bacterium]
MSQAYTQPEGTGTLGTTRIGPYEVLTQLALGGMAELLLARRVGIEGFQKLVVLKRILPQYANNPEFVEMFLHEARLAATLEHPNIVQVFDIGKAGGDYFFAMAYLHGKDVLAILRELSGRGRALPLEHAIAIAMGVAAGLHHAHEQVGFDGQPLSIVHRDVSPANAIVTYDGTVKLVDFGIAKAAARANVTRVGVRKGKAAYMSPEQCKGDPLDRRTDLWSLGVVLYEMVTMARLFKADNDLAIMHRITALEIPPPSSRNPAVPPVLDAIIMRCLQRSPTARYATADALLRDLDGAAASLGLRPSPVRLGEFVRELFGSPPLPSATTVGAVPATGPVTSSIDVEPGDGTPFSDPSDATRDLGASPPPQANTRIAARVTRALPHAAAQPEAGVPVPVGVPVPTTRAAAPRSRRRHDGCAREHQRRAQRPPPVGRAAARTTRASCTPIRGPRAVGLARRCRRGRRAAGRRQVVARAARGWRCARRARRRRRRYPSPRRHRLRVRRARRLACGRARARPRRAAGLRPPARAADAPACCRPRRSHRRQASARARSAAGRRRAAAVRGVRCHARRHRTRSGRLRRRARAGARARSGAHARRRRDARSALRRPRGAAGQPARRGPRRCSRAPQSRLRSAPAPAGVGRNPATPSKPRRKPATTATGSAPRRRRPSSATSCVRSRK